VSRKRAARDNVCGLGDLEGGDSTSGRASSFACAVAICSMRFEDLGSWLVEVESDEGNASSGAVPESGEGNIG
jgi:hypothetical protein